MASSSFRNFEKNINEKSVPENSEKKSKRRFGTTRARYRLTEHVSDEVERRVDAVLNFVPSEFVPDEKVHHVHFT